MSNQLLVTPWTVVRQSALSCTVSWSLLRFTSIESVMLSNHLILCCPFLLLPSIFASINVFSNESALCISLPKYWSFSFSISPSNKYSVLISFRIDLFDLLAVQGTLKSFLQHHSLKASILPYNYIYIYNLLWHAEFSSLTRGLNPGPLHWECRILITGLPEKSRQ